MPPSRLLSFGIPPENSPAKCEGASFPKIPSPFLRTLLRSCFSSGTGGKERLSIGFNDPGTGGAVVKANAGPNVPEVLLMIGADRSLVVTFLRGFPLLISDNNAFC